jgi:hypothetical protein
MHSEAWFSVWLYESGSKLMVNTMVGDLFDMEDTSIALACSNIATSLTAGSAFIIGTSCIQQSYSMAYV